MPDEFGTIYVLQSIWSPGKKLFQTILEAHANIGSISDPGGRTLKHTGFVKKRSGRHLFPCGVVHLINSVEPKLQLGTASPGSYNALMVPVSLSIVLGVFTDLVDSGSSDLFIDSAFVLNNKLVSQSIKPHPLSLIDSMVNNFVKQIVTLPIKFPCGMSFSVEFFVTLLDSSCEMVLGHNWLSTNNSEIDWKQSTLQI